MKALQTKIFIAIQNTHIPLRATRTMIRYCLTATVLLLLSSPAAIGGSLTVIWPTPYAPYLAHSYNQTISEDGQTIAGDGWYWTAADGPRDLSFLPGFPLNLNGPRSYGISSGGKVMVGGLYSGIYQIGSAWRWSAQTGYHTLNMSEASGVSGDGSIVVGVSPTTPVPGPGTRLQGYRWTQETGAVLLGTYPVGSAPLAAMNISDDGSTIVGSADFGSSNWQAFRHTAHTGMVGLGYLPGDAYSKASDVSSDGTVIVGTSGSSDNSTVRRVFRWTQATGMVDLGFNSNSVRSSADGNSVVSILDSKLIWTDANGVRTIEDAVAAAGIDMQGFSISRLADISGNGRYVLAQGVGPGVRDGDDVPLILDFGPVPEPNAQVLALMLCFAVRAAAPRRRG